MTIVALRLEYGIRPRDFDALLHDTQPQLFLLTETQLRSDISPKIANYTLYGKKREGKIGGGVAILVRNVIVPNVTCHLSERNIEAIWVNIRRIGKPPLIMGSYYGKQESRTSKYEIDHEMHLFAEERMK